MKLTTMTYIRADIHNVYNVRYFRNNVWVIRQRETPEMRALWRRSRLRQNSQIARAVRSEFFQRIKRASAIEQKAIPRWRRYTRAITGHRDITGPGVQFISRFAPTASGANGAKKSAVSADSIFIDTGKQLGRIYYFTRARAPMRAVVFVFVCFHGSRFIRVDSTHQRVSYRRYLRVSFWMAAIFCDVPITFETFE